MPNRPAQHAIPGYGAASGETATVTRQERRREPRRHVDYMLAVTTSPDGSEPMDESQVENINSRGVFFYLAHALPLDKIIHLTIAVAPGGGWMQRRIEVKAEGRVVRSHPEDSPTIRYGTAVEFVRPLTLRFEGNYAT